jgi:hypothetical protein
MPYLIPTTYIRLHIRSFLTEEETFFLYDSAPDPFLYKYKGVSANFF